MDDLISRQAAMDALGERPAVWVESDYELGARNQYDADVLALETVPSAPRWIPCEERLPEEDTEVLVTGENGEIDIALWKYDSWTEDDVVVWEGNSFSWIDPVAWMPLPEPWKGEEDD